MDIIKTCKLCNTSKPITDYYQNKNTGYYHSNCLKCVNDQRKMYKTNGNYIPKAKYLDKFPEDIRNYVRDSIKNPDYDIKEISNHTGISKPTLLSWIKNNRI